MLLKEKSTSGRSQVQTDDLAREKAAIRTSREKKPKIPRRGNDFERATKIYMAAFACFFVMSFVLYLCLDTEEERRDFQSLMRRVHAMHRAIARRVRLTVGIETAPSPIGDASASLYPPSRSRTIGHQHILPRPQVVRFSQLRIPEHVSLEQLAPLSISPAVISNSFIVRSSAATTVPSTDRTQGVDSQESAEQGGAASVGKNFLQSARSDLKSPQKESLRGKPTVRPIQQILEANTSQTSTQTRVVSGGNPAPEQLKPSQKARLKAMSFTLGHEKVEQLLSKEVDVVLSQLLLEMRGSISCGGRPIMSFREYDDIKAVSEHLTEVIPERNDLLEKAGTGKSLGTCAVVGNSGALLDDEFGEDINKYDTVIRFNAAPTKGFEKSVGSKTTIRIQNVDHLGYKERQDVALVFSARSDKDVTKYISHRRKPQYKTRTQYMFNPEFWCHVWDWVAHRKLKPSSGMAGVVLALHNCEAPVGVFGFSHNSSQFHYYDVLPKKVTQEEVYWYHPLVEEAAIFQELESLNKVKVFN